MESLFLFIRLAIEFDSNSQTAFQSDEITQAYRANAIRYQNNALRLKKIATKALLPYEWVAYECYCLLWVTYDVILSGRFHRCRLLLANANFVLQLLSYKFSNKVYPDERSSIDLVN